MAESWTRILVPIDEGEFSRWALDRVSLLIERPGAVVTLLTVVPTAETNAAELNYRRSPQHDEVVKALSRVRDDLVKRSITTEAEVRFGDPATEILREIGSGRHDVVAMATHGRSGMDRVLFGSVAQKVLRASTVPVLLFRPLYRPDGTLSPAESHEPARFRHVLVPLDGSPAAEEIVPAVRALASVFESKLHLFQSVPGGEYRREHEDKAMEYLRMWQARLGAPVAEVEVRVGAAGPEALAIVRGRGLDGVALTTHGRSGLPRALYGSVAEKILRQADVPVLSICNHAVRHPLPAPDANPRFVKV